MHNVETTFCNVVLTFLEPSVKVSIESSWASDDYGFVTRSMVLILLSEKILLLIKNTTNKKWKIFLTVVQIVIHNVGNNGDIHRILKIAFKISRTLWKILNIKYKYKINIFYISKKTNLKAERMAHSTG